MDKTVLDACCGSRMMWFNKQNDYCIYMDNREETIKVNDSSNKLGHRMLTVRPDLVADFTNMPFEDAAFWHVVFDPPHMTTLGENSWMAKKYGRLFNGWESIIQQGFLECMRVLKENGTLIFKWNEHDVKLSYLLDLIKEVGYEPLYGHTTGRQAKTHWMAFMKMPNP